MPSRKSSASPKTGPSSTAKASPPPSSNNKKAGKNTSSSTATAASPKTSKKASANNSASTSFATTASTSAAASKKNPTTRKKKKAPKVTIVEDDSDSGTSGMDLSYGNSRASSPATNNNTAAATIAKAADTNNNEIENNNNNNQLGASSSQLESASPVQEDKAVTTTQTKAVAAPSSKNVNKKNGTDEDTVNNEDSAPTENNDDSNNATNTTVTTSNPPPPTYTADSNGEHFLNLFSFASGRKSGLTAAAVKKAAKAFGGDVALEADDENDSDDDSDDKSSNEKAVGIKNNSNGNKIINKENNVSDNVGTTNNLFSFASGRAAPKISEEQLKQAEARWNQLENSNTNSTKNNSKGNAASSSAPANTTNFMFATASGKPSQQPSSRDIKNMNKKLNGNNSNNNNNLRQQNSSSSDEYESDDDNDTEESNNSSNNNSDDDVPNTTHQKAPLPTFNNKPTGGNLHQPMKKLGGLSNLGLPTRSKIGTVSTNNNNNNNNITSTNNGKMITSGFKGPKKITPSVSAVSSTRTSTNDNNTNQLLHPPSLHSGGNTFAPSSFSAASSARTSIHHLPSSSVAAASARVSSADQAYKPILDFMEKVFHVSSSADDAADNDGSSSLEEKEKKLLASHKSFEPANIKKLCNTSIDEDETESNDDNKEEEEQKVTTMMSLLTEAHFGDQDPVTFLDQASFVFCAKGMFSNNMQQSDLEANTKEDAANNDDHSNNKKDPLFALFFDNVNTNNNKDAKEDSAAEAEEATDFIAAYEFRNALIKLGLKPEVLSTAWVDHHYVSGILKLSHRFFIEENLAQQQQLDSDTDNDCENEDCEKSNLMTLRQQKQQQQTKHQHQHHWLLLHPLALLADMISVYNQEYLNGFKSPFFQICTGDREANFDMIVSVCGIYRHRQTKKQKQQQQQADAAVMLKTATADQSTDGRVIVRVSDGFYTFPLKLDDLLQKDAEATMKHIEQAREEGQRLGGQQSDDEDSSSGDDEADSDIDDQERLLIEEATGEKIKNKNETSQQQQQCIFLVGQKLLLSNAKSYKADDTVSACTPLELPNRNSVSLVVFKNGVKLADPFAPLGWVGLALMMNMSSKNSLNHQSMISLQPPVRIKDIVERGGVTHAVVGRVIRVLSSYVVERIFFDAPPTSNTNAMNNNGAAAAKGTSRRVVRNTAAHFDTLNKSEESRESDIEKEKQRILKKYNVEDDESIANNPKKQRQIMEEIQKVTSKYASVKKYYEIHHSIIVEEGQNPETTNNNNNNNNNSDHQQQQLALVEIRERLQSPQDFSSTPEFIQEGKLYRFMNVNTDPYQNPSQRKIMKKLILSLNDSKAPGNIQEVPSEVENNNSEDDSSSSKSNNNNKASSLFLPQVPRNEIRPVKAFGDFRFFDKNNDTSSSSNNNNNNKLHFHDFIGTLVFTETAKTQGNHSINNLQRWWFIGQDGCLEEGEKNRPCLAMLETESYPGQREVHLPKLKIGTAVALQNVMVERFMKDSAQDYCRLSFKEYSSIDPVETIRERPFWKNEVRKFKEWGIDSATELKHGKKVEEIIKEVTDEYHRQQEQKKTQNNNNNNNNNNSSTTVTPRQSSNNTNTILSMSMTNPSNNSNNNIILENKIRVAIDKHFHSFTDGCVSFFDESFVDHDVNPPRVSKEMNADAKSSADEGMMIGVVYNDAHQTSLGSSLINAPTKEEFEVLRAQNNAMNPKKSLLSTLNATQGFSHAGSGKNFEDFLPSSSSSQQQQQQQDQHRGHPQQHQQFSSATAAATGGTNYSAPPSKPKTTVIPKSTSDANVQTDAAPTNQNVMADADTETTKSLMPSPAKPTNLSVKLEKECNVFSTAERNNNNNNNHTQLLQSRFHLFGNFDLEQEAFTIGLQFVPHHHHHDDDHGQQQQEDEQELIPSTSPSSDAAPSKPFDVDDGEEDGECFALYSTLNPTVKLDSNLSQSQPYADDAASPNTSVNGSSTKKSASSDDNDDDNNNNNNNNRDDDQLSLLDCSQEITGPLVIPKSLSEKDIKEFGIPVFSDETGTFYVWLDVVFKFKPHQFLRSNGEEELSTTENGVHRCHVSICNHSMMTMFLFGSSYPGHVVKTLPEYLAAVPNPHSDQNSKKLETDIMGSTLRKEASALSSKNIFSSRGPSAGQAEPERKIAFSSATSSVAPQHNRRRQRSNSSNNNNNNNNSNDNNKSKTGNMFADGEQSDNSPFSSPTAEFAEEDEETRNQHKLFAFGWIQELKKEFLQLSSEAVCGRDTEIALSKLSDTRDLLHFSREDALEKMFECSCDELFHQQNNSSGDNDEDDQQLREQENNAVSKQFSEDGDAITKIKTPSLTWAAIFAYSIVITDAGALERFERAQMTLLDENRDTTTYELNNNNNDADDDDDNNNVNEENNHNNFEATSSLRRFDERFYCGGNRIPDSQETTGSSSTGTSTTQQQQQQLINSSSDSFQIIVNNTVVPGKGNQATREEKERFVKQKVNLIRRSYEDEQLRRRNLEDIVKTCGSPFAKHLLREAIKKIPTNGENKDDDTNNNKHNKKKKSQILKEKKYCVIPPFLFWTPGEWNMMMLLLRERLGTFRKVTLRRSLVATEEQQQEVHDNSNNNNIGNNNKSALGEVHFDELNNRKVLKDQFFLEWCGTLAPKSIRVEDLP